MSEWCDRKISFDPHLWHSIEDWKGCRLVLTPYSINKDGLLPQEEREKLLNMGFELPGRRKRGHATSGEDAYLREGP